MTDDDPKWLPLTIGTREQLVSFAELVPTPGDGGSWAMK
jgi:hypothetical protein